MDKNKNKINKNKRVQSKVTLINWIVWTKKMGNDGKMLTIAPWSPITGSQTVKNTTLG